jgi:peptide/nickel transport system substrate-binding protein
MWSWSRLLLATIGIPLLLALLLAGCAPGTASTGFKQGGSLTVLSVSGIPERHNFNPFLPASSNAGTQGMIYETLLYFNQLQGGKVTPWLAASYHFSEDAKSVTFTLRSDVKWSDGNDFTSADVVFTLNLLKRFPALDTAGLWKVITSVNAPDRQTVIVTFNQPSTPILWSLAGQTYIVPEHIWKHDADPTSAASPGPVGTGPFVLKAFPTNVTYVLARNPLYWQPGKPSIDQITYEVPTGGCADCPIVTPNFDWTGVFSTDIDQVFAQQDPAHNHYWFPSTSVDMLYLNLAKAPFNQVAVRQAISAAIDRQALSTQAEDGYDPVASPTALVLPANQRFLDPKYQHTAFGAADPARADAMLEAAGFKKGSDGVYADASGQKLAFTLDVVDGWSDWMDASKIIVHDLNAAGMRVTLNPLSYQDYFSALTSGTFDAAIAWTASGPTPYYLYNALLASSNVPPAGLTPAMGGAWNWEHWIDPKTDQLLAQYAATLNPTLQQQALSGLEQIMVEQLPAIPLFDQPNWFEYSTARFTGWPTANNPYALPSPWSAPDNEMVALTIHQV